VELLDGYLVNRMPQNPPHASCTQRLNRWLIRTAPPGWVVRVQLPVTLSTSEPEPDAAIARGDDHAFDTRHPQAADFGIVVEVANTSLILDRQEKGRLYAQSGIPVYWIINLIERIVEVYTDPDPTTTPPAYRTRTDYPPGQAVPIVLDGQTVGQIPVDDLLP
jgi:Uma2 family endonuclease